MKPSGYTGFRSPWKPIVTLALRARVTISGFRGDLNPVYPSVSSYNLYLYPGQPRETLPLPPNCLPKLIPKMENLATLTLVNISGTSLTELIPALSEVPTLRDLTLHELNSEGTALLCHWLSMCTCQLEKLTLPTISPDHIETLTGSLSVVSSLKTLFIQSSIFTQSICRPLDPCSSRTSH